MIANALWTRVQYVAGLLEGLTSEAPCRQRDRPKSKRRIKYVDE